MNSLSHIIRISCLICLLTLNSLPVHAQIFSWVKSFGGKIYDDALSSCVDRNGNTIVCGTFRDTVDFDPGPGVAQRVSAGNEDIYIAKYSSSGSFLWVYVVGSVTSESVSSVTVDSAGNIYSTGGYRTTTDFDAGPGVTSLTASLDDVFVLKISSSGSFVWVRKFSGSDMDYPGYIVADKNGNTVVNGNYFSSSIDLNPGTGFNTWPNNGVNDAFIVKLDNAGNMIWGVAIGGQGNDYAGPLCLGPSGEVFMTGDYNTLTDFDPGPGVNTLPAAFSNNFVLKLTSAGTFSWVKTITESNPGSMSSYIYKLVSDPAGNVLVALNANGSIDVDPAGTGIVNINTNLTDAVIVKWSGAGTYLASTKIGGIGDDNVLSACWIPGHGYAITGRFPGTVDFDNGSGVTNLTATGSATTDGFILWLDSSLNYLDVQQLAGLNLEQPYSVNAMANGDVIVTGFYYETVDFNSPAGATQTSINASSDIFILRFNQFVSCNSPVQLYESNVTKTSAKLNWTPQVNTLNYQLRYKVTGATTWTTLTATNPWKWLSGLLAGSQYIWQVRSKCSVSPAQWSAWSVKDTLQTNPPVNIDDARLSNQNSRQYLVSPNPVNDLIFLQAMQEQPEQLQILLYNAIGEVVLSKEALLEESGLMLDVGHLSSGVYIMMIIGTSHTDQLKVMAN